MDFRPDLPHLLSDQGVVNRGVIDHLGLKQAAVFKGKIPQDRVAKTVDGVDGGSVECIQRLPDLLDDGCVAVLFASGVEGLFQFFLYSFFSVPRWPFP